MKYLSQRDLAWASDKLGASSLTVGRYGCTTTSISMLTDYFKCYKSPKEIAAHKDWYTKGVNGGLILWSKLSFAHMGFVYREYGEHPTMIEHALNDPNKAVILEVNDKAHWVVAVRKTLWGNDYVVVDPWTGKKCYAKATYKNVTGAAYFGKI